MAKPTQMELPLHFDIHPSVVLQLGDVLVSDVVQALVELVKNSYDADYAKVTIRTSGRNKEKGTSFSEANGVITVEENGDGMDLETIRNGWLYISNRSKRAMKQRGKTTRRGRTPLGDKGLSRLGTQRLGRNFEIFTQSENAPEALHVSFTWEDFLKVKRLSDVKVNLKKIPARKREWTKLVISDLKEIDAWRGPGVRQLEGTLPHDLHIRKGA